MRILTTTMCYPAQEAPDRGVFVQRRAEAVARRADVCVVSPQPWCPLLRRRGRNLPLRGALPTCYPRMFSMPVVGWAADGLSYAAAVVSVLRHKQCAGEPPVDLIDGHFEYPDGVGAWLAARWLGLPVVVTLRGKLTSLMERRFRRAQIRSMLYGVDAVVAVSESLSRQARQLAGDDLRVDVIPNGVDTTIFHPVNTREARSRLGWDQQARYLVCVGHYQALKGFDRLVAIMPAVRAAAGDVRLVLVGSRRGESRFQARLDAQLAASPAGKAIHCLGPVDAGALNLLYSAADLAVNASRSEGWCNAISESLAAGTPVVAGDVGGNREQICADHLGIIVPEAHGRALAGGVIAGLARRWDRAAISAQGARRGWDQVATEVIRVYERVLGERARQAWAARSPIGRHLA